MANPLENPEADPVQHIRAGMQSELYIQLSALFRWH